MRLAELPRTKSVLGREALHHLLTKEGKPELRALVDDTTTTAEMLAMFPSAKVPLEYLIDFVPVIKPRLYSIASASEMHPNHIHCCIVEEDVRLASRTQTVQNVCTDASASTSHTP